MRLFLSIVLVLSCIQNVKSVSVKATRNVIIISVEEFQPLTEMSERNRILHFYNIAMNRLFMTLLARWAHIINVEY